MCAPSFFILLSVIAPVYGLYIYASLGDSVEFPPAEKCKDAVFSLMQLRKDDSRRLVASLDGDWRPGPDHQDRIKQSSPLTLDNVNVNDTGYYEYTCDDSFVVHLEVFIPSEVYVSEGEAVTLPCHSEILTLRGQSVMSVLWEKEKELVLRHYLSNGVSYGAGWEGSRVSVPEDWLRRGDLSLTIPQALQTHEGLYYCYTYRGEERVHGTPPAVRLRVGAGEHQTQRTLPPAATPQPSHCPQWTETTWTLTAVLVVLTVLWFVCKLKSRRCKDNEELEAAAMRCLLIVEQGLKRTAKSPTPLKSSVSAEMVDETDCCSEAT